MGLSTGIIQGYVSTRKIFGMYKMENWIGDIVERQIMKEKCII